MHHRTLPLSLALASSVALGGLLAPAIPAAASESMSLDAAETIAIKTYDPDDGAEQALRSFACPPAHPWLSNVSAGWGLPGMEVQGVGYDVGDVTLEVRPMRDVNRLAIGWDGTATAVKVVESHDADFTVVAHCTNDPSEAYPG